MSWSPNLQLVVCGVEAAELIAGLGAESAVQGADAASLAALGLDAAGNLGADCGDATALAPELPVDLALLGDVGAAAGLAQGLEALGFRTLVLAPESLNDVVQVHHELGRMLGREERARERVAEMTSQISAIATLRDGRPRRRVVWLLEESDAPGGYVAVGATGILHELLELAGAENAFHEGDARLQVDGAAIRAAAPDVVLVSSRIDVELAMVRVPSELARQPVLAPVPRVRALHALVYPEGSR